MSSSSGSVSNVLAAKYCKKQITKDVLCTPYTTNWPIIEKSIEEEILQLIKRIFDESSPKTQLKNKRVRNEKKGKKRREKITALEKDEHLDTKSLRSELTIGISNSLRCMQNDELCLVIIDSNAPKILRDNFFVLCSVRNCSGIVIRGLSQNISHCLGIKSVLALGFKKCFTPIKRRFDGVVQLVSEKLSDLATVKLPRPFDNSYPVGSCRLLSSDTAQIADRCQSTSEIEEKSASRNVDNQSDIIGDDVKFSYVYKTNKLIPRKEVNNITDFNEEFISFDSEEKCEMTKVFCHLQRDLHVDGFVQLTAAQKETDVKRNEPEMELKRKSSTSCSYLLEAESKKHRFESDIVNKKRVHRSEYKKVNLGKMVGNIKRKKRNAR